MSKTTKDTIQKQDWKYVNTKPDPNFDPEHNRKVIANTIKKNEILVRKKKRDYKEKIKERAEAMATYIESLKQGGKESDVTKYFGRRYLAKLRGEEIMDKLAELKKSGKMGKQVVH